MSLPLLFFIVVENSSRLRGRASPRIHLYFEFSLSFRNLLSSLQSNPFGKLLKVRCEGFLFLRRWDFSVILLC